MKNFEWVSDWFDVGADRARIVIEKDGEGFLVSSDHGPELGLVPFECADTLAEAIELASLEVPNA